jgi:hypothetical protein
LICQGKKPKNINIIFEATSQLLSRAGHHCEAEKIVIQNITVFTETDNSKSKYLSGWN